MLRLDRVTVRGTANEPAGEPMSLASQKNPREGFTLCRGL
jgi:hypothetical protein